MTEAIAVVALAMMCGVWVLVQRTAQKEGCGGDGRCGACGGGGSCSRSHEGH